MAVTMADIDQIGSVHDAFVDLLNDLPRHVLLKIVCAAAGLSPDLHELEVRECTPVIEIPSAKRRARRRIVDLLLTVHTKDGRAVLVIVIEVQLSFDSNKRWDWPMVHVAFAAQFQASGVLAAFIPEPQLREKIREKLGTKMETKYTDVEPDQIELITDIDEARRRPAETLLGAVYHVWNQKIPEERRLDAIKAAHIAIQPLEQRKLLRYTIIMTTLIPQDLYNRMLDELRARVDNDPIIQAGISETERLGWLYNQVLDDGLEKGRRELLRRAICDFLELRGFVVDAATHDRIQTCNDTPQLQRWYDAARTGAPGTPLTELLR